MNGRAISQQLISFKIDKDLLHDVDIICGSTGIKRNKLINYSLRFCVETAKLHKSITKVYTFYNALQK